MTFNRYVSARKPQRWFARRTAGVIVAMSAVATGVAVATPPAQAAGGYQAPIRSGNAWPSGVFHPGYDTEDLSGFETYRGRPLDVAVTWPSRWSWGDFTEPNEAYSTYSGQQQTMVYGVPMLPEDPGVDVTMAGCAAGSYNSRWTTFGHTLTGARLGSSIIRLGWEMNGDWYRWAQDDDPGTSPGDGNDPGVDPAVYAECFRQIVTTVRKVAPNLKFDWTVNRGSSAGMPDDEVYDSYPGDGYVDVVGVDSYDAWADWNWQLTGDQGLNDWLAFALAHGKKLSVPEWGLFVTSNHGNGDNATYIQNMYNFFRANAANLAYEAYFNEPADYIGDSLSNLRVSK